MNTHLVDGGFTAKIILRDCDLISLTSITHSHWLVLHLADILGMTAVGELVTRQIPPGLSVGLVIAESHIFLHTWPESASLRLIIDSCVDFDITLAVETVKDAYETDEAEVVII